MPEDRVPLRVLRVLQNRIDARASGGIVSFGQTHSYALLCQQTKPPPVGIRLWLP